MTSCLRLLLFFVVATASDPGITFVPVQDDAVETRVDLEETFHHSCPEFGYTAEVDPLQYCCGTGIYMRRFTVPGGATAEEMLRRSHGRKANAAEMAEDARIPVVLELPPGILDFQVNVTTDAASDIDVYLYDKQAKKYVVHWMVGQIHGSILQNDVFEKPNNEANYGGVNIVHYKGQDADQATESVTLHGWSKQDWIIQVGNRDLQPCVVEFTYKYAAYWDSSCGSFTMEKEQMYASRERKAKEKVLQQKEEKSAEERIGKEKVAKEKSAKHRLVEQSAEKVAKAASQKQQAALDVKAKERKTKEIEAKIRAKQFVPKCVLKSAAPAGATEIHVDTTIGFNVGDIVKFSTEEPLNEVSGFGSLILKEPLQNELPVGAVIVVTTNDKERMVDRAAAKRAEKMVDIGVAKAVVKQKKKDAKERASKENILKGRLKAAESATAKASTRSALAQGSFIVGLVMLLLVCLIGVIAMMFLRSKRKDDSQRTLKAREEQQALLLSKKRDEIEEQHKRKREQEWYSCRQKAQEDGAWIYWLGGDSCNRGCARIYNGYLCFNKCDIADTDHQDKILKMKVGKEFIFWADNREYVGNITVAPVINDKGEMYLKTDNHQYPEHYTLGVFCVSAFEYVYYQQTRLIYYTASFLRTWPLHRLIEYGDFLLHTIGLETIGSAVPTQSPNDRVLPWILEVQKRFLRGDISLGDREQASKKNEKNRLLEMTRKRLRAKQLLHCDALPFMPNSAALDEVSRWVEEMQHVAEALAPLKDIALVITITTDGKNPNAQTVGMGRLEDLLTGRAETVRRQLVKVGVADHVLFVGVPRYKYKDRSGVHSKLILEPVSLEEGAQRQSFLKQRTRKIEELRDTVEGRNPLFIDAEFLPNKEQFSPQERDKALAEMRPIREFLDGTTDILCITVTTTAMEHPDRSPTTGPSKLATLLQDRAKTIQNLLLEVGVDRSQTKIMEPVLGHDRHTVVLAFENTMLSLTDQSGI